jgi:histidine racemase
MKLSHVVIARPGGNDTALVFDHVLPHDYREVNSYVQQKKPTIEQVMFVQPDKDPPTGNMAGGEFCGNATRALGYYLLEGKDGTISLRISGANSPLVVSVIKGMSQTEMPIINDPACVQSLDKGIFLVHLEGITHLVLEPTSKQAEQIVSLDNIDNQKMAARELLEKYKLMEHPASGVMALSKRKNEISMLPYVYVKAVDTFYAETACGSGSVAVGLVLAKQRQSSLKKLGIYQPSGKNIFVDVDFIENRFVGASISGEVEILYEGEM